MQTCAIGLNRASKVLSCQISYLKSSREVLRWYPNPSHSTGWITSLPHSGDVIHSLLWHGSGYRKIEEVDPATPIPSPCPYCTSSHSMATILLGGVYVVFKRKPCVYNPVVSARMKRSRYVHLGPDIFSFDVCCVEVKCVLH